MIGVFDSGFGGLQTLKYLKNYLPHENFVFLADSLHVPYGNKSHDQIKEYTTTCINWLCDQGCETIIIACNTAVAGLYEDRKFHCQDKNLIGVTYAGVLDAIRSKYKSIGVLCTQATYDLQVYPNIYKTLRGDAKMHIAAAPELVNLIECGESNQETIRTYIKSYISRLPHDIDCLILGCTHYPVYLSYFWELFPQCHIIDPGRSCIKYLAKGFFTLAKEVNREEEEKGSLSIYCTGNIHTFKQGAKQLWSEHLSVEHIELFASLINAFHIPTSTHAQSVI